MKILIIIHGYPPRYNAGSEVDTQSFANELMKKGHVIEIFTRYENPFEPDFTLRIEEDPTNSNIKINLVNIPNSKDRYIHKKVDFLLLKAIDRFKPEIIHIGHLNHLSTSIPKTIKEKYNIPIIYTLHDYWLMCPRGQFIQFNIDDNCEPFQLCDGQKDVKCAYKCNSRYISGSIADEKEDIGYWTNWVKRRMKHIRDMTEYIDIFIAPSKYLLNRYRNDFKVPEDKLVYLDYGFDLERFKKRARPYPKKGDTIVFGYIGTHIPAKGIHHLIKAFGIIEGKAKLKIWGRHKNEFTPYLKEIIGQLPDNKKECIKWMYEYQNENIVRDVFNNCDVIVVPSIWMENSPLVIHEAQQARLPVITADAGGMAEYVKDGVNGLLFQHRNPDKLAECMQKMIDNSDLIEKYGKRGYLYSESKDIPSINEQVSFIIEKYNKLMNR